MAKLSLSRAWDETRAAFARDSKLITTVALALIVLPQVIVGFIAPPATLSGEEPPSWMSIVMILVLLTAIVGQIAILRLALGPSISVSGAISHGVKRLLPAFAALIIVGILLAIILVPLFIATVGTEALESVRRGIASPELGRGVLLVLLVVVLVSPKFQLLVPVAAGEPGGPVKILKRSWQITNGHYWKLLGLVLLFLILALVVVLFVGQILAALLTGVLFGDAHALSLGALFASLIAAFAQGAFVTVAAVLLAKIYGQLAGPAHSDVSVPSSGT